MDTVTHQAACDRILDLSISLIKHCQENTVQVCQYVYLFMHVDLHWVSVSSLNIIAMRMGSPCNVYYKKMQIACYI